MIHLENKKILFLSVRFFNYENAITSKLKDLGAEVDFYDERPSNSILSKGIIRLNKKLYQLKINNYYQKILIKIKNIRYDYFLLIKGEATPVFFLKKLKELNPNIKTIYYSFDSFDEYPDLVTHLQYFDQKFTFDRKDAIKYKLHFRPLFFIEEYHNPVKPKLPKYNISFIGSTHTDRYIVGEKVKLQAEKLQLNTFFYYYAMGGIAFRLKRIFDKNLKYFDPTKVSFQRLTHQQIIDHYNSSSVVLDINKPFQNGLTIRTFEVLALEKKLITTNADIVNYPFYNPMNIAVINRENVSLNKEFFSIEFQKIDEKTLYMMSLYSFIECLFVENQDEYWLK